MPVLTDPASLSVSVVIPVHSGGDAFVRCLDGLAEAVPPPDEVIVVADGETDGVWRYAERYGAADRTRVLVLDASHGPAHARNVGAGLAEGDVLFFVDADVVVAPDVVGRVRARFAEDHGLDAVIGSYDDAPGHRGFLSQYRNLLHHYTHQHAHAEATTFWGACGAVRREAFAAVGGFDAAGFRQPSVEDIELGYRLRQAGCRIALDPDLQVKHLKQWTPRQMLSTDVFKRAAPWTGLLLEYHRLDNDLNLETRSRLSVATAFALVAVLLIALGQPLALFAAPVLALVLADLNKGFYRFLVRKKGWGFALRAVPWHWAYFLCGGLGALLGASRHLVGGAPARRPSGLPELQPLAQSARRPRPDALEAQAV